MAQPKPVESKVNAGRSSLDLARAIAVDVGTLVRKEMELARQEIVEAVGARAKAAAAGTAGGMLGLVSLVFFGLAGAAALATTMPLWAAAVIVGGGFLVLAGVALAFAKLRMKHPSLAPAETKRTVKEDIEWAKAQLKR